MATVAVGIQGRISTACYHTNMNQRSRILLCILDGWGIPSNIRQSAITPETAPFMTHLYNTEKFASLSASGTDVGLPPGIPGNSEVGHMVLGTGSPVKSPPVFLAEQFQQPEKIFLPLLNEAARTNNHVHLFSLLSDGYIHAHSSFLIQAAQFLKQKNITLTTHLFLDGRDSPIGSYHSLLNKVTSTCPHLNISTLSGRDFAMDRTQSWHKISQAYNTIVHGHNKGFVDPSEAVDGLSSEEFFVPQAHRDYQGFRPTESTLLFLNFRSDRTEQIVSALADPNYDSNQTPQPTNQNWFSILPYTNTPFIQSLTQGVPTPPSLSPLLTEHRITQTRIAETEKLFHVTHFFDAHQFQESDLVQSHIAPSLSFHNPMEFDPNVATNSIAKLAHNIIHHSDTQFTVMNFAAPDLAGHTGDMSIARQSVSCVDRALSHVIFAAREKGITCLITADHGNVDSMILPNGKKHTGHSTNEVPFFCLSNSDLTWLKKQGTLCDVAPTILKLLNISPPTFIQGSPLCQ